MATVWTFLQALLITFVVTAVSGEQCLSVPNPSCQVSTDCLNTQCTLDTAPGTAFVSIQDTCEDPVIINFRVRGSNYPLPDYRFFVFSDYQSMTDTVNGVTVLASYGRNATHLNFSASLQVTDIRMSLVPFLTIPLNPAACMCQTTRTIPQHISTPPIVQTYLQYNCSSDPSCLGVRCTTTLPSSPPFSSELYIEPCLQELRMSVNDSSGDSMFNRSFTDSEDIPISIPISGLNVEATIVITIVHFNFSMDVEVNISAPLVAPSPGLPILSRQKIVLDRSRCSTLTYFPGTFPSYQIIPHTGGMTPPPHTTPSKPSVKPPKTNGLGKSTVIAIGVAVPISAIFGLLTVALVIAVVFLVYRQRKNRGFQRMRFKNINDDEEAD